MPGEQKSLTFDDVLRVLRNVCKELQPGGPPVDYGVVCRWLSGNLSQEQEIQVAQRLATWKAWYDAHQEIIEDLAAIEKSLEEKGSAASVGVSPDLTAAEVSHEGRNKVADSAVQKMPDSTHLGHEPNDYSQEESGNVAFGSEAIGVSIVFPDVSDVWRRALQQKRRGNSQGAVSLANEASRLAATRYAGFHSASSDVVRAMSSETWDDTSSQWQMADRGM